MEIDHEIPGRYVGEMGHWTTPTDPAEDEDPEPHDEEREPRRRASPPESALHDRGPDAPHRAEGHCAEQEGVEPGHRQQRDAVPAVEEGREEEVQERESEVHAGGEGIAGGVGEGQLREDDEERQTRGDDQRAAGHA